MSLPRRASETVPRMRTLVAYSCIGVTWTSTQGRWWSSSSSGWSYSRPTTSPPSWLNPLSMDDFLDINSSIVEDVCRVTHSHIFFRSFLFWMCLQVIFNKTVKIWVSLSCCNFLPALSTVLILRLDDTWETSSTKSVVAGMHCNWQIHYLKADAACDLLQNRLEKIFGLFCQLFLLFLYFFHLFLQLEFSLVCLSWHFSCHLLFLSFELILLYFWFLLCQLL